jgi:H+/Cl- antiporter ClcA
MKNKVVEASVLFVSIIKWLLLSTITGIVVGLSTSIFLKSLEISINLTKGFKYYFLLLPVAMFLSTLIVKYLAPEEKRLSNHYARLVEKNEN